MRVTANAAEAADAARRGALDLHDRGIRWSDRDAVVAAHSGSDNSTNRLDVCLIDMTRVCAAQKGAPDVRDTLRHLATHAFPRGEFELPPSHDARQDAPPRSPEPAASATN